MTRSRAPVRSSSMAKAIFLPVLVSRSRQPWTMPATATFSKPRARQRATGVRGEAFHVLGVARQRVAGDVEAESLLLQRQPLALAPLLLAEDALLRSRLHRLCATAEEAELARLAILLRGGALLQG